MIDIYSTPPKERIQMKKTMMKSALAATMLFSGVIGPVGAAGSGGSTVTAVSAATATAKPSDTATTATKPTTAPIMRDNLSSYGLKKAVELPVTVEAGGLSYTLEKIMIYDIDSAAAKAIRNKYGYSKNSDLFRNPKYFVWTKITIVNKSKKIVQQNASDVSDKWFLAMKDSGNLYPSMPYFLADKKNNISALWSFKLNPSEKLSTYQGFVYEGELKYFAIRLYFNGMFTEKFIVERPNE
jgi:hypothetical protein